MRSPLVPSLQQSRLAAGTAVSWRFDRATVVGVQQGRVWITLDGDAGDWFLDIGMAMRVPARQRMVLEAAGRPDEPALLSLHAEAVPLTGALQKLRRRLACKVEAFGQGQECLEGGVAIHRP